MSDTYLTRKTLVRRLKLEADENSWQEFELYYSRFIRSIVMRMGINGDELDDLTQQVKLKVWQGISQFDHQQKQGSFRNWLFTITRRTVLNYLDKVKRQQKYLDDAYVFASNESSPEVEAIVQREWEKHLTDLAFKQVSQKMSKPAIEAFAAGVVNEPAQVTAERLGLAEETIYIYRHRVKKSLMAEIQSLRDLLE